MNGQLSQRARAAAVALWQVVVIGMVWMTAGWLIWMGVMRNQPEWYRCCWGSQMDWDAMQTVVVCFFGLWKLMLFAMVLAALWLTLWSRRLKRIA
ncbi:MAG: hypothetical protein SVT52_07605 [Planctomycetota bacterium]|nr:hypothetical protein [Planctomycetota bacterium]